MQHIGVSDNRSVQHPTPNKPSKQLQMGRGRHDMRGADTDQWQASCYLYSRVWLQEATVSYSVAPTGEVLDSLSSQLQRPEIHHNETLAGSRPAGFQASGCRTKSGLTAERV